MPLRRSFLGFPLATVALLLAAALVIAQDLEPTLPSPEQGVPTPTSSAEPTAATVLPAPALEVVVEIGDDFFEPITSLLLVGGTARWTSRADRLHTVTSFESLFQSGTLARDQQFTLLFAGPGDYAFFCEFHPQMQGVIRVIAAGAEIEPLPPFSFPALDPSRPTPGPTAGPDPLATPDTRPAQTATPSPTVDPNATPGSEPTATPSADATSAPTPERIATSTPVRQPTARAATPMPTPRTAATAGRTPSPTTGSSAPSSAFVEIRDNFFIPHEVRVAAGGTVTWANRGVATHTVTGFGFDSQTLPARASWQFVFGTPGTYTYVCSVHSSMNGVVVVQ